ncbi:MAG: hypothetical protein J5I65_14190, partial [Aridibacter famidurans]|nr:hypothetical protein [Aridibacter famidurans]
MIHPRNILSILAFLILTVPLAAQVADGSQPGRDDIVIPPEKANPVVVPFFDEPPVIDGRLDEDIWQRAATFKDFIQTEPGDLIPPSRETIAYMGYDSKNLDIAYCCSDEPDTIRATVAKRDP